MDKREMILAIALSLAVFAGWTVYESWYVKHHPPVAVDNAPPVVQPATPTTAPTSAGTLPEANPSTAPTTTAAATHPAPVMAAAPVGLHAIPATQPSTPVFLGSAAKQNPTYAIQLALMPGGAGIRDVTLNSFTAPDDGRKKDKDAENRYVFETVIPNHDGTEAMATRTLVIDGTPVDLNVPWRLVSASSTSATYAVRIDDADGPVAEVSKTYEISTRAATKDTSLGYEVTVEDHVQSLRPGKTIKIREVINGPTPPPTEVEVGSRDDRNLIVGYNKASSISVSQHFFPEFKGENVHKDLTHESENHFAWAGQFSSYFGAIVLPDPAQLSMFTVHADAAHPPNVIEDADRNVALTFETPEIAVAPGTPASLKMNVFFGPKAREALNNSYYASMPRMYDQVLIIKTGLCAYCTFSPVIAVLVWILDKFHWVLHDWGLAIIGLVLLVRTLLHPITKKSQVQMMKMGKLGPEVEKLKVKYADQPDVLNREMMQLYKQQGGAMLGCLPMFLQTPIWIALWTALQGTFELRQAPFLYGMTWIKDLAKPDRLINIHHILGHSIPLLFGFSLAAINILPLLMAVVTYINQKYFMPMPPAATPEQEQQQKMQRGMSLLFPLMFYSMPSGLNLYYLTSMSLGILESKIIRKHIKEQEEAEKAGRVFVTVKPTRSAKRRDDQGNKDEKVNPGFMGRIMEAWMKAMADAQKQAEELKKQQSKKDKKR